MDGLAPLWFASAAFYFWLGYRVYATSRQADNDLRAMFGLFLLGLGGVNLVMGLR